MIEPHETERSYEGERNIFQAFMIGEDVQRTQTESVFGMPKIQARTR